MDARSFPPLSDPRWLPLDEVFRRILQRTGDVRLAEFQLNREFAGDRIQFWHQSSFTGDDGPVPSGFGANHRLRLQPDGSFALFFVDRDGNHIPLDGRVFFAREPHVEKVWPARRPREERVSLKHLMILAIAERANPKGWEGVSTAAIERQVGAEWKAECESRGDAAKEYINTPPKRHAIDLALGRCSD
jgi:hypothetical protein